MYPSLFGRALAIPSSDDGGDCGQVVEDPDHRVLGRGQLDLFQRDEGRFYQAVHLGNTPLDSEASLTTFDFSFVCPSFNRFERLER